MESNDTQNLLNVRFPAGTMISLGIRKFVHSSEAEDDVKISKADFEKVLEKEQAGFTHDELDQPDIFVEALLDVGGLTVEEAVQKGGGDAPVTYQKLTREKSTLSQVNAWRRGNLKQNGRNADGYLIVVLDPKATATEGGLGIPLSNMDKMQELFEKMRPVFDAAVLPLFENDEPTEAALEMAGKLYDSAKAMTVKK